MKTSTCSFARRFQRFCLLSAALVALWLGATSVARAGLTVEMHFYHYVGGYYCYPFLSTNTTLPNIPAGDYLIASPQVPANGTSLKYHATATTFDFGIGGDYGGASVYSDFDSFLFGITNGLWSIWVTNGSTTQYKFRVTATSLTSNLYGAYASISFPLDGTNNIATDPVFTWTGPANWAGTLDVHDNLIDASGNYNYVANASLTTTATSWFAPILLPAGTNNFDLNYSSNATAIVVASTPTNNAGAAISGWLSTAILETSTSSRFVVATNPLNQFLVARYDFEDTNSPGHDSTGNGNDNNCSSSSGPQADVPSTDAAIHLLARRFFGDTSYCFYPGSSSYLNLSNALAHNFSVTAWVKTTNSVNTDFANAYFGAPVFVAAANYATNNTVPLAITGNKAAFTVIDQTGGSTTIHSTTSVNNGSYHFLAVTRNQASGLMSLYVDGNLEATGTSTTQTIFTTGYITLAGGFNTYAGLLDDLRIYSTNLSSGDIASLAARTLSLADALDTTNLTWITGGDANWYPQTTNTHDTVDAAQSGVIGDNQQTWIETTVTGPGTLNFWWKASSEGGGDYLEFLQDGGFQTDLTGDSGWQNPSYSIAPGSHTLRWNYYKNSCCTDFLDAAFLDQVSFTNSPSLDVTANPQSGVPPLTVQFTSPGVDSSGHTVTNWAWNFGDGGISPAQSPAHVYTNAGFYSPSLVARSTAGTTPLNVTGLGTISVSLPTLNANATPQSGQTPLTVQFSTPSLDSAGFAVTNWNWTFGDGGTSTAQNPAHTYIYPGMFSPSLVARSAYSAAPITIVSGFTTITVTNPPNPSFHILHSFTDTTGAASTNGDGKGSNGGLVLIGSSLYGTAQRGGGSGFGTLFALNTDGSSFTNLYNFSIASNSGAIPPAGVVLSGSRFFGTTAGGGSRGGGTIFAINTNGLGYTNLLNYNSNVDPNSGGQPLASVALVGNTLYGTTWFGGAYDHGTLSYVTTNGTGSGILHHFITPSGPNFNLNYDGLFPSSKLIFSGGTLYGTAEGGGTYGRGTVFAVDTNNPGSFRILHYFTAPDQTTGTNTDGANPFAGLVLSGNTLYGTTFDGGRYGNGTVFAVNTDGSGFTNLYSFTGSNGDYGPHSTLTLSANTLYGTTSGGGLLGTLSSGTLFAINTDGSGFKNLYSFSGGSDGANPQGDLVFSGNTLYGSAFAGGASGNGIVFSFSVTSPVLLINPQIAGVNFQFQFQSQAGFTHAVQYRTNLVAGLNWQTYSNVTGDGALKTIPVPRSVFSPAQQGFVRILTQ